MTSIDDRIVLAAWPALVVAVLVLPLPGVPFVIAFAVLVSVFVLLARSNLVLRLGKVTIGALWLVSLACLVYFFITFGAGVYAADMGAPVPPWAKIDWLAGVIGMLALLSATVALWLPPKDRTTMLACKSSHEECSRFCVSCRVNCAGS